MWKCHKCGKPVYFAERKQSLGYDWHPECLRCEECGKRLNPGQHAEHKGIPYCHVPCYGALFGPQLYGHGTRVESHTSFGKVENKTYSQNTSRSHLESKLRVFNQFYDSKSCEIKCREVNGRLVLEGALRIYWGVSGVIHLKEDDDQRTVVTVRKRNSCRNSLLNGFDWKSGEGKENGSEPVSKEPSNDEVDSYQTFSGRSLTLPPKLDLKSVEWSELDDLLKVERQMEISEKLYQTLPGSLSGLSSPAYSKATDSNLSSPDFLNNQSANGSEVSSPYSEGAPPFERGIDRSRSNPEYLDTGLDVSSDDDLHQNSESSVVHRRNKGSTAIRRRPGKRRQRVARLRRRCSINGHFYNRETSFFTPPFGSQMSVWVTSLVSTSEVINLMLDKYKVDSRSDNFALFIVRDNGEQRMLREDEYPLMVRVMLGPHEDVAKLYLMDRGTTEEISPEVAQFLNLSSAECNAILNRYKCEQEREEQRIISKYKEMRKRIKQRMEELKVRL